jgi:FAD/FMN-containing dehydrogenase
VLGVEALAEIQSALASAGASGLPVSIAGGRHAMGGHQFCRDGIVLDTRKMNRVLDLDTENGIVEVEAGIQWPDLIAYLNSTQPDDPTPWVIAQKQTGADRLTIGGSIAANIHGRGLAMKPFVADIESFVLVDASGQAIECSRTRNRDLFRLAAGGYGLFGCIYSARIRLVRRRLLERIVELETVDNVMSRLNERIENGFEYGDFQFATDPASADFLRKGIFACYRPVEREQNPPATQAMLSAEDWRKLTLLAHTDKQRAFDLYSQHYLKTSGQLYYSDQHQLAQYEDGYHREIDSATGAQHPGSEMISELYVPRENLADFMAGAREDFRLHGVNVIYGTVRLIEQDEESFLAWARSNWACVIFNLHTEHTPDAIENTAAAFRRLIDLAMGEGGSYFLTYHRWADRTQVETCHPRFVDFLRHKRERDPKELFQSDWYLHYRSMFSDVITRSRQDAGGPGRQ